MNNSIKGFGNIHKAIFENKPLSSFNETVGFITRILRFTWVAGQKHFDQDLPRLYWQWTLLKNNSWSDAL